MPSGIHLSSANLMNVREIIESAFGDLDGNAVNFKLVQTVLFLIARQMKILERRVEVELGPLTVFPSESTLSVTEVKVHTMQKKKKGGAKPKGKGGKGKPAGVKPGADKGKKKAESSEEDSPTPTASASSMQAQHEKLLVVKTVPSSEARKKEFTRRMSQVSLVTQEQFEKVAEIVRELEKRLLPGGSAENIELMQQLRRGASLTDGMAALQLSARLEATEKALNQMTSMVTLLVKQTPGVTYDSATGTIIVTDPNKLKKFGEDKGKRAKLGKSSGAIDGAVSQVSQATSKTGEALAEEAESYMGFKDGFINYTDLYKASRKMKADMLKALEDATKNTMTNSENAQKLSAMLDATIDTGPGALKRMADLESAVKKYADQINAVDTYLSAKMTAYQELLTQMQQDLEVGLDNLNEALGNAGSDTEAMAELHTRFTTLQLDFDNMTREQKYLKDVHMSTTYDLANLWKKIEMLKEMKSDREEVAEALRYKAGIGELNGLVTIDQFEAVRGDFGKRITAAFDKFNVQEKAWQKSIESAIKIFNEKADLVQVQCLKDDINKHLNRFKERMQIIQDIVGDPQNPMVSKKVFRDTACLSCGSPAHMESEEENKVPKLPSTKKPAKGDEPKSQTQGGGDYRICYPDSPIPHQRDPRSYICKRYCGGAHTMETDGLDPSLPGMTLKSLGPVNTAPDGQSNLVDEQTKRKPCLPCNKPKPEKQGILLDLLVDNK